MKCPNCKKARLRQLVNVIVECDADCRRLCKAGIRASDVSIHGAGWPSSTIFCSRCRFILRTGIKKKP